MKPFVPTSDFPKRDDFIYLNAANVALMYEGCRTAISDWYDDVAFNGSNNFNELAEAEVFDTIHDLAAQLINVNPTDIAVGSSATELLSSLAWAIAPKKGENIISTDIVFPSTVYPWQRVANSTGCEIRLVKEKNNFIQIDDLIELIDQNTAVVSISHVEYANGQTFDLELLAEAAHDHNALLVVDATQSAGAIPIDVQKSPIDVLVSGAYKWLCGPFGSAFMYIAPHLLDKLEPGLVGFRSHENMWDLDGGRITYPATGRKFEFSTMAFGSALGLAESINYINDLGVDNIFEHNHRLAQRLIEGLQARGAEITSPLGGEEQSAIVMAYFEHNDPDEMIDSLNQDQVFVSCRGKSIRFSPHIYNTSENIDKALAAIDTCIVKP